MQFDNYFMMGKQSSEKHRKAIRCEEIPKTRKHEMGAAVAREAAASL